MQIFMVAKMFLFFFLFLLLPDKVYADIINSLQYCVAKMQTKSEMHVKYGHAIFLIDIRGQRQVNKKKCNINEPKMV